MSMLRLACCLCAGLVALSSMSQNRRSLRVVSWNVENMFDTIDAQEFRDEEFLPSGERRWTGGRYWHKMADIARVVASLSDADGVPDLIGLCEVENDSVLETLTKRSALRTLGYEYVMTHSRDARGINVALLYQPVRFRLLQHNSIKVPAREGSSRTTRDILHVKGLVKTEAGIDTLHILVVHLPSKTGGRVGDQLRSLAARTLWNVVDSLNLASGSSCVGKENVPRIVVIGDFNATAKDRIFRRAPLRIVDDKEAPGTYCFRGFWQWIDHVLLSSSVDALSPAKPMALPWMLEENKTYGVSMPRRTYRGAFYHGGVSDHLPLLVDLQLK